MCFNFYLSPNNVQKMYRTALRKLRTEASQHLGMVAKKKYPSNKLLRFSAS